MISQLQFLNLILATRDFGLVIKNNLNSSFFRNFSAEFNYIQNHYKNYGQVPDTATFLNVFPEFNIIEVRESANFLLNELYKGKNEEDLVQSLTKVKDLLVAGKTEEAFELFKKESNSLGETKHLEAMNILEDTSRYDAYLDKCNNFNKYYISTGFEELDESIGGIDRLNSYFVISARPGIGKTLLLVKFAAAAVRDGLRVGFYEGEMEANKIAGRYDTLTSHISNGALTHGNINVSNQYKSYLDSLKHQHGKFYLLTRDMVDSNKVTVDTLESFIDKYQLDILFVDQLSLLDTNRRFNRGFEQAEYISRELKNLQVRKHIPLVVASQLNRGAADEGKIAGTENIAGSDRIVQDCTEAIALTKKDTILKLSIIKARDGAKTYELKYEVDFDKGLFTYIPDGELPAVQQQFTDEEDYGSGGESPF